MCLPQTHLLGADLLSSITDSERINIETFCELGLSNIQMSNRLKRSPATISYELARCEPYQAELAQTDCLLIAHDYWRLKCRASGHTAAQP